MNSGYIHERFLELPLFQGMSRSDLDEVFSSVAFSRVSCGKGHAVIHEGNVCDRLFFLSEGRVQVSTFADDRSYRLTECLTAPTIMQPERIFGLTQRFTCTVIADTDCEFISISKQDITLLSDKYEIFRINLLNIISTRAQRMSRAVWRSRPHDIRHKIARFVEERSLRPAGNKILNIKMERLATEIKESRLNVSRELNAMNMEGLIILHRGEIEIPALEKITQ